MSTHHFETTFTVFSSYDWKHYQFLVAVVLLVKKFVQGSVATIRFYKPADAASISLLTPLKNKL